MQLFDFHVKLCDTIGAQQCALSYHLMNEEVMPDMSSYLPSAAASLLASR